MLQADGIYFKVLTRLLFFHHLFLLFFASDNGFFRGGFKNGLSMMFSVLDINKGKLLHVILLKASCRAM